RSQSSSSTSNLENSTSFVFNKPIWDSLEMYKVHSVSYTSRVTFGNTSYNMYSYKDATKRHKFLVADITITSKEEEPLIPAFNVYYLQGDIFVPIAEDMDMDTEKLNEDATFRTSDKVRYKIYTQVPDSISSKYPIYILATKDNPYKLSDILWGRTSPKWAKFDIKHSTEDLQVAYVMK
ncbi:MAG: hypothetical protein KBT32_11295, partial [Bacteroidales bacterium]|nr:hypothetical protein [Candidatus Physcocola equi]